MTKTFKFIVSTLAAFALVVSAASASYTHTGLLKMGMTSSQVMSLQQTLNGGGFLISTTGAGSPGMESMYFGAKTKAAVMAFQTAKGLGHDGIVGAQTGAALAAMTGGTTTGGTYPIGCTSTSGFSPVTGLACNGTTTGGSTGSTGGALTGGAGSVQSYKLLGSPSNNQNVGEDQNDVKVLGFSVEADNSSDLNVKSIKLDLNPGNVVGTSTYAGYTTSSSKFEDYADAVSVWYGSTKLATINAADFNDDSNNDYVKTVSFNADAIVRKGDVGNFYITVDGANNLDSNDLNMKWAVDVTQVRFVDAQGAVVTEDPTLVQRTFDFESFSSANDVELRLSESSSNPDAMVVKADLSNSTNDVVLLKGTLKAVGSDLKIRSARVTVTPAGTGDVSEIASQFTLKIDGQTIESVDSADCTVAGDCDGTGTTTAVTYIFNDNDITVSEGDTVDVVLTADINEVDGTTFVAGDSLTASMDADNFDARDSTNSDLTTADTNGTINGNAQTFFTKGLSVTAGSITSAAQSVDGAADYASYTMKINVTAIDEDVYLDKSFVESSSSSTTAVGSNRVNVVNSSGTQLTSGFSAAISSNDNNSQEKTNTYKISDGQTASFTITVNATGTSAQQRAILYALEWGTADNATLTDVYTSNMGVDGDYKTGLVYVSGV